MLCYVMPRAARASSDPDAPTRETVSLGSYCARVFSEYLAKLFAVA